MAKQRDVNDAVSILESVLTVGESLTAEARAERIRKVITLLTEPGHPARAKMRRLASCSCGHIIGCDNIAHGCDGHAAGCGMAAGNPVRCRRCKADLTTANAGELLHDGAVVLRGTGPHLCNDCMDVMLPPHDKIVGASNAK